MEISKIWMVTSDTRLLHALINDCLWKMRNGINVFWIKLPLWIPDPWTFLLNAHLTDVFTKKYFCIFNAKGSWEPIIVRHLLLVGHHNNSKQLISKHIQSLLNLMTTAKNHDIM